MSLVAGSCLRSEPDDPLPAQIPILVARPREGGAAAVAGAEAEYVRASHGALQAHVEQPRGLAHVVVDGLVAEACGHGGGPSLEAVAPADGEHRLAVARGVEVGPVDVVVGASVCAVARLQREPEVKRGLVDEPHAAVVSPVAV